MKLGTSCSAQSSDSSSTTAPGMADARVPNVNRGLGFSPLVAMAGSRGSTLISDGMMSHKEGQYHLSQNGYGMLGLLDLPRWQE